MFTIFNLDDLNDEVDPSTIWQKSFKTERSAKTQITRYKNKHCVKLDMIRGTLEDNFEEALLIKDLADIFKMLCE